MDARLARAKHGALSGRFVSAPLTHGAELFDAAGTSRGEPPVPLRYEWRDGTFTIAEIVRTWRSTNTDRGDTYLARHWYEVRALDGRTAVIYFDRKARASQPRWWLYTITELDEQLA